MIQITNLSKSYDQPVFQDVTLNIPKNKITFFVGKNGVGKTTLMEILIGLNHYETGEIKIDGEDAKIPYSLELRKKINFLPTSFISIDTLTVSENLSYYSYLYKKEYKESYLTDYQLVEHQNKFARDLSHGLRKRLDLAIFELIQSEIMLLDEPSLGLDVYHVDFLRKKILEYKEKGKTVLVTSHDMQLCEKIADTVLLFKEQTIVNFHKEDVDVEELVLSSYQ